MRDYSATVTPSTGLPAPSANVTSVDVTAIRDAFGNLEQRIRSGHQGSVLLDKFKANPLQFLKEAGVDLTPLSADPEVWQILHTLLRSDRTAYPEAAPALQEPPKDEKEALKMAPLKPADSSSREEDAGEPEATEEPEMPVPSEHVGFSCWACNKAAETAIALTIAGVADQLRKGVHEDGVIAAVASALAPILGVSTTAATESAMRALIEEDGLQGFVDRLAHEACLGFCS